VNPLAGVETTVRNLMPADVARALLCAQRLFTQMLHEQYGAEGRAYLDHRAVPEAHVRTYGFGLGLAGYRVVLESWGVQAATQQRIGLLDDRGRETMVDRITFPWLSIGGRHIIGIGGRSIRDGERRPKYDNSPESLWFAKGRAVFGLAQAAQAIHGSWALVSEGPFDAEALARMGWTNSVATVGAKITLDQLFLVARLTDTIVVMLDDDEGGHRGREALQKLVATHWTPPSLDVRTATLRGVKDASTPGCTPELVRAAVEGSLSTHR
jgi:DNA primase